MQDNQIAKFPDYLLEFEEIAALATWQKAVIRSINTPADEMLREMKMDYVFSQEWEDMLGVKLPTERSEDLKKLYRKYYVTTWDILKDYIRIWLSEKDASLEYDKESFTVKVRVQQSVDSPQVRKWTRDILPCNLNLDFAVEEAS